LNYDEETDFLFIVTVTIDFDLHDLKSIAFFHSLWAGHIPNLELIAWSLKLCCRNGISIFSNHECPLTLTYMTLTH